jgi:hypothetical protein
MIPTSADTVSIELGNVSKRMGDESVPAVVNR